MEVPSLPNSPIIIERSMTPILEVEESKEDISPQTSEVFNSEHKFSSLIRSLSSSKIDELEVNLTEHSDTPSNRENSMKYNFGGIQHENPQFVSTSIQLPRSVTFANQSPFHKMSIQSDASGSTPPSLIVLEKCSSNNDMSHSGRTPGALAAKLSNLCYIYNIYYIYDIGRLEYRRSRVSSERKYLKDQGGKKGKVKGKEEEEEGDLDSWKNYSPCSGKNYSIAGSVIPSDLVLSKINDQLSKIVKENSNGLSKIIYLAERIQHIEKKIGGTKIKTTIPRKNLGGIMW